MKVKRLENILIDGIERKQFEINGIKYYVARESTDAGGLYTWLKAENGKDLRIKKKDDYKFYNKHFL